MNGIFRSVLLLGVAVVLAGAAPPDEDCEGPGGASPAEGTVRTFQEYLKALESVPQAAKEACRKLGVDPRWAKDPALLGKIPASVMAYYRPKGFREEDLLSDVALAQASRRAGTRTRYEVFGNKEALKKFEKENFRERLCAYELFGGMAVDTHVPVLRQQASMARPEDVSQLIGARISEQKRRELMPLLEGGEVYLEGHKPSMKPELVLAAFHQVMREESEKRRITPKEGIPHRWSAEFRGRYPLKFFGVQRFNKVLMALANGYTSQYLPTGTEDKLEEWMLKQPDRSIEPAELFRQSYVLSNGDVYLSILTIENVLSRYWRHPERHKLELTMRLKPIINSFGSDGDKFGACYHFFGIMLYGYLKGERRAQFISGVEAAFSRVLSRFEDEAQEDFVNVTGAKVGGYLKKSLKRKDYFRGPSDPKRARAEYYLDLSEDFSNRIRRLKPRQ